MSRTHLIIVFACAFAGLALAILVVDWKFTDPGVRTGARVLFGAAGFIAGFLVGKWFLFGSLPRKVGRAD
jgi:hypothetical protein